MEKLNVISRVSSFSDLSFLEGHTVVNFSFRNNFSPKNKSELIDIGKLFRDSNRSYYIDGPRLSRVFPGTSDGRLKIHELFGELYQLKRSYGNKNFLNNDSDIYYFGDDFVFDKISRQILSNEEPVIVSYYRYSIKD